MNVLYLAPGMRALTPDEYAKPDGQRIRDLYLDFSAGMFRTLGDSPEQARADALTVLAIETELSAAELTPLQRYDPAVTYNMLSLAEAQALVPAIDLGALLGELGVTPPRRPCSCPTWRACAPRRRSWPSGRSANCARCCWVARAVGPGLAAGAALVRAGQGIQPSSARA
jgi:hypothetical protein